MFDIVGHRYRYFAFSAILIGVGIVAMIISTIQYGSPLRLSVDFTGGALWEVRFDQAVMPADVRDIFVRRGLGDTWVQTTLNGRTALIRSKPLDPEEKSVLASELRGAFGPFEEMRFESVGPTIGREVTRGAAVAVAAAAIVILGFIIFAFRKMPNATRYGVCAVIAMLHDVLVAAGFFAVMGLLRGWEVDALFLTAVLTVIGFSVNDTIVVFDRIRENLPKRRGEPFEVVVNRSLLETLHRSLVTSVSAIFVLIAIIFFGGATIQQFVSVLLIGMVIGTYSSICNAVPMLVAWENGEFRQLFGRVFGKKPATA